MSGKVLIIYCDHEVNDNLLFFSRNGYIDDPKYTFIFIFNNPTLDLEFVPKKKNIMVLRRDNVGFDFGGWTYVLFQKNPDNSQKFIYEEYDYFIFLNSTIIGPFFPLYYKQKEYDNWIEIFIKGLNDEIKLVGTSVAFFRNRPFISSSFLVTDQIGLRIGINKGIFDLNKINLSKRDIVLSKEMGLSNAIIDAGYNIKCMLKYYENIDFRKYKPKYATICHLNPHHYYEININPYEIIFIKQNRNIEPLLLKKYTEWHLRKPDIDIKVKYGFIETESIDISNMIVDILHNNKYILTNSNITEKIKFNNGKKLFIYLGNDKMIIDETNKINFIFI